MIMMMMMMTMMMTIILNVVSGIYNCFAQDELRHLKETKLALYPESDDYLDDMAAASDRVIALIQVLSCLLKEKVVEEERGSGIF